MKIYSCLVKFFFAISTFEELYFFATQRLETPVAVRDEAGAVTDAWINLDLLREGSLTILTTNPTGQPSAVGDIIVTDADAAPVYYNLQGVRVAADNLTPGVYVKVVGTRATKVIVK